MQGKLPIKSNPSTLMSIREGVSSSISQKSRPAGAPIPKFYPMGPPPDGSEFHGALPWIPCPVSYIRSPSSLSLDTEDGIPYHPGDEKVAMESSLMPSPLENEWHEEQHFHPSFLEDKSFLGFFY